MACKPNKAIEKFTDKVDYWVEATSLDEFVNKLMNRYGGYFDTWKEEVKKAIRNGKIIPAHQNGRHGYRTQNEHERASTQPALVSANRVAQEVMA